MVDSTKAPCVISVERFVVIKKAVLVSPLASDTSSQRLLVASLVALRDTPTACMCSVSITAACHWLTDWLTESFWWKIVVNQSPLNPGRNYPLSFLFSFLLNSCSLVHLVQPRASALQPAKCRKATLEICVPRVIYTMITSNRDDKLVEAISIVFERYKNKPIKWFWDGLTL